MAGKQKPSASAIAAWLSEEKANAGGANAAHMKWPKAVRDDIAAVVAAIDAGEKARQPSFIEYLRKTYKINVSRSTLDNYLIRVLGRRSWTMAK